MNENMFSLPDWNSMGSSGSGFSLPAMNLPTWDMPDLGGSGTSANPAGVPNTTSAGGYQPLEFGMNIPSFQLGLNALGSLGSLWGSFQSTKLAKDAFNFQKSMAEKNYGNQIKSYNTALTDRATSRGFVQGDSAAETQQYINENKL